MSSLEPQICLNSQLQCYECVCVSCYGMALKQQPTVSSLWHDLGVCYYHLLKVVEGHSVKVVAGKCRDALRQAVKLAPMNHVHWNALGVVSAHDGLYLLQRRLQSEQNELG